MHLTEKLALRAAAAEGTEGNEGEKKENASKKAADAASSKSSMAAALMQELCGGKDDPAVEELEKSLHSDAKDALPEGNGMPDLDELVKMLDLPPKD
eukprot:5055264-Lingulodinium_polyedra.AAC.1